LFGLCLEEIVQVVGATQPHAGGQQTRPHLCRFQVLRGPVQTGGGCHLWKQAHPGELLGGNDSHRLLRWQMRIQGEPEPPIFRHHCAGHRPVPELAHYGGEHETSLSTGSPSTCRPSLSVFTAQAAANYVLAGNACRYVASVSPHPPAVSPPSRRKSCARP